MLNTFRRSTLLAGAISAVIAIGFVSAPDALAGKQIPAICSFKQTRMSCNVEIKEGRWRIQWQDGVSETYQELANGNLKDARGGIWRIYSRKNHTYLKHANGNIIDIFY